MSPIGVGVAVGEPEPFGSTPDTPDGDAGVLLPDTPDVLGSLPETFDEGCIHLHEITATRHAIANKPSLRFVIILGSEGTARRSKRLFRHMDFPYCLLHQGHESSGAGLSGSVVVLLVTSLGTPGQLAVEL